jgi:hypothetical protein
MKTYLKYCTYCGPEWVDWIIHDPELGPYCSFCGFSLVCDEPDPQDTDPFGYGRCPVCGEWLVPADNLLYCRCPDPVPIQ